MELKKYIQKKKELLKSLVSNIENGKKKREKILENIKVKF